MSPPLLRLWLPLFATGAAAAEQCSAQPSRAGEAVERFLRWVDASAIPGAYSTPAQRAAQREHPGDLTHTRIFQASGPHSVTSGRHWPHTKPNQVYQDDEAARERMVAAVAWLLRRGMSRLQDAVLLLLREVAAAEVQPLLALARRALNSFEDFWRSVRWTVAYGPRQTEWRVEDEMKEYGPETNFWLKFRPLLACQHAPRLGPELGGAKAWCNPHAWPRAPRHILSAGAGDDMLYESIVARLWPGVTVVTPDCFQYTEESAFSPPKWGGSEMLMLPVCLSGKDPAYADLAPRRLRERFVTYPQLLADLQARHGVEGFEFIKCNIEASEYPLFAHVMQDPDANLRGTLQINIEMHRMGMHDYADVPPSGGRDFNSLLFMQLLWATFLSGGFHPVFVEKWHDRNAAADVVWVNQTFWLHSELDAARTIWDRDWPDVPLAESTYPDAAELASQHARGVDPYRAPTATRTLERQQKVTGAAGLENTAALSGGGAMAGSDGTSAAAPAAGASGANKVRKLSAKRLRKLKKAPALVMVDPTGCEQCAELSALLRDSEVLLAAARAALQAQQPAAPAALGGAAPAAAAAAAAPTAADLRVGDYVSFTDAAGGAVHDSHVLEFVDSSDGSAKRYYVAIGWEGGRRLLPRSAKHHAQGPRLIEHQEFCGRYFDVLSSREGYHQRCQCT